MIPRAEIAGIALAIAAVLGGLAYLYHDASRPPHPMPREDLARTARQLASDAREGARLAALASTGQMSFNYARAHHRKLADDVHDAVRELDAPAPAGGAEDVRRLRDLGQRMHALLEGTTTELADANAMRKLQDEHTRIAIDLEAIAAR